MKTTIRLLACAAIAAATSSCVTTGDLPRPEGSPAEAARTNLQLGVEYVKRGQHERALDKFKRAVSQDPHLGPAHAYLGYVYEQVGQPGEAEKHYKTALRLDDDDATVRNMYAVYLCRNDRIKDAEKHFLAAATVPAYKTSETAYTNAGLCVLKLPDNEKAEGYFRQALQINPEYPDALWQMAKLSRSLDRDFQSRAFLQRLAEVGPLSAQALLLGVQVERKMGDNRTADRYGQELRLRYPDSEEARRLAE